MQAMLGLDMQTSLAATYSVGAKRSGGNLRLGIVDLVDGVTDQADDRAHLAAGQ